MRTARASLEGTSQGGVQQTAYQVEEVEKWKKWKK
jgi:hypothetical protein